MGGCCVVIIVLRCLVVSFVSSVCMGIGTLFPLGAIGLGVLLCCHPSMTVFRFDLFIMRVEMLCCHRLGDGVWF